MQDAICTYVLGRRTRGGRGEGIIGALWVKVPTVLAVTSAPRSDYSRHWMKQHIGQEEQPLASEKGLGRTQALGQEQPLRDLCLAVANTHSLLFVALRKLLSTPSLPAAQPPAPLVTGPRYRLVMRFIAQPSPLAQRPCRESSTFADFKEQINCKELLVESLIALQSWAGLRGVRNEV